MKGRVFIFQYITFLGSTPTQETDQWWLGEKNGREKYFLLYTFLYLLRFLIQQIQILYLTYSCKIRNKM